MKLTKKLLGITAIIAVIGFLALPLTGCDNDTTSDDGGGGGTSNTGETGGNGTTFTSLAEFAEWLANQPDNDTTTTYRVKLNIDNLGGNYDNDGSAGKTLKDNSTKYVSLDLSGSTFMSIESYAFFSCHSLTGITIPDIRKTARFT